MNIKAGIIWLVRNILGESGLGIGLYDFFLLNYYVGIIISFPVCLFGIIKVICLEC